MKKFLIKTSIKFGVWLLVKKMRKEINSFPDDDQRRVDYKEITNAILTLIHHLAKRFNINISIKKLDPSIEKERKLSGIKKAKLNKKRIERARIRELKRKGKQK